MPDPLLSVKIPGTPRPQGSLRVITPKHGRAFAKSPEKMLDYRATLAARLAMEWTGEPHDRAVVVIATFGFPRPLGHWHGVTKRRPAPVLRTDAPSYPISANVPDVDKLCRLLGDAMQLGGVLVDDRLIIRWDALKMWTDDRQGWTAIVLASTELTR